MKNTVAIDLDFVNSLMKVKGLSESEFAQVIGVSHSMVNRVMNGKRNGGNKFIAGVLNSFQDVSYSQLVKHAPVLTKGNKPSKKTA